MTLRSVARIGFLSAAAFLPAACAGAADGPGSPGSSAPDARMDSAVVMVVMERTPAELADVTLAVPARPREAAVCGAPVGIGGREVRTADWREDGRLVRRISVSFTPDGRVRAYTDMRGELVRVLDHRDDGPGTSIHIQVDGPRIAYVQNVADGRTTTRQVDVDEALASPALDEPGRWVEWIRECAAPTAYCGHALADTTGWTRQDEDGFTFLLPSGFERMEDLFQMDSQVGVWTSGDRRIFYDFGEFGARLRPEDMGDTDRFRVCPGPLNGAVRVVLFDEPGPPPRTAAGAFWADTSGLPFPSHLSMVGSARRGDSVAVAEYLTVLRSVRLRERVP